MLTFAVVTARSGGRIPAPVLDLLRDQKGLELPFEPRHHLVWSNDSDTVWFAGWQDDADGAAADHHWHVDNKGLTAFAGDVWPRRDGWRGAGPWAAQLAERLRLTPMTEESDDLAGVFVAASLNRRGHSSIGTDPLGVGLAYCGEGHDITVISTRASVAAGLLAAEDPAADTRDVVGAGWVAYSAYPIGDRTGFERVRVVPEDACITIDASGCVRMLRPARSPWRPPEDWVTTPEAALDVVQDEMVAATRMARARPGDATASGLTGGKDSRLILALLLLDDATDGIEFQTYGADDLPDVAIARRLAQQYGLHHVINPGFEDRFVWRHDLEAAVRADGYADISSRELALRITSWMLSGVRNVSEAHLGRSPAPAGALMSGGCGELLRTNFSGSTRLRSKEQVAGFPDEMRFGTAEILRPEVLDHYRMETHRVMFEGCRDDDSPQDVVDTFYIRARLRRWLGTELEVAPRPRVFPLYSITAVRLAFAIGARNRHSEWIHFHLMRAGHEPLVHEAFANDEWRPGADGKLAPPDRHDEPCPAAPPPRVAPIAPSAKPLKRTRGRDARASLHETDVAIMERFLTHDSSNPVFELLDPVATEHAVERFTQLGEREQLQVYGALSAAIWLGGHEIALPGSTRR